MYSSKIIFTFIYIHREKKRQGKKETDRQR